MAYSLSLSDIKQVKRVLASQLPGASSARLTEAVARGLRFSTNAALLSALSAGSVDGCLDDAAFRDFLSVHDDMDVPEGLAAAALSSVKAPQAHSAIAAVMAREPDLSCDGMRTKENASLFTTSRMAMLGEASIAEFQRALEWLGTVRQTSRIDSKWTSYGFKHQVERYHADRYPDRLSYVSNGMFIAAALHLGFRIRRDERASPNVLLNLSTTDEDRARKRPRGSIAGPLRGAKNLRAWRNLMVAGVNAGLEQGLFGLGPDDNCWSGDRVTFHFEFDGLPALASVSNAGYGELAINVAINPNAYAENYIRSFNAGLHAGDAFASGYLERKLGAWLQTSANPIGSFRRVLLDRLSDVSVLPLGFVDTGKFMM